MKKLFLLFMLLLLCNFAIAMESSVEIKEGWNLVSLSSNIFHNDDILVSYLYNPFSVDYQEDEYIMLSPKLDSNAINNYEHYANLYDYEGTLQNTAIWVYSKENFLYNTFFDYDDADIDEIKLLDGWNFIGIRPEMIDERVGDFFKTCNINAIFFWDSYDQSWNSVSNSDIIPKEVLWKGLVINANSDCYMNELESIPNVPSLPELEQINYWKTSAIGILDVTQDSMIIRNNLNYPIRLESIKFIPYYPNNSINVGKSLNVHLNPKESFKTNVNLDCDLRYNIELTYVNLDVGVTHVFDGNGNFIPKIENCIKVSDNISNDDNYNSTLRYNVFLSSKADLNIENAQDIMDTLNENYGYDYQLELFDFYNPNVQGVKILLSNGTGVIVLDSVTDLYDKNSKDYELVYDIIRAFNKYYIPYNIVYDNLENESLNLLFPINHNQQYYLDSKFQIRNIRVGDIFVKKVEIAGVNYINNALTLSFDEEQYRLFENSFIDMGSYYIIVTDISTRETPTLYGSINFNIISKTY